MWFEQTSIYFRFNHAYSKVQRFIFLLEQMLVARVVVPWVVAKNQTN